MSGSNVEIKGLVGCVDDGGKGSDFEPVPYSFKIPNKWKKVGESAIISPPNWLLLDHAIAVIWYLFSTLTPNKVLDIDDLKWAYEFLKDVRNAKGDHPPDVKTCLMEIQDRLITLYAQLTRTGQGNARQTVEETVPLSRQRTNSIDMSKAAKKKDAKPANIDSKGSFKDIKSESGVVRKQAKDVPLREQRKPIAQQKRVRLKLTLSKVEPKDNLNKHKRLKKQELETKSLKGQRNTSFLNSNGHFGNELNTEFDWSEQSDSTNRDKVNATQMKNSPTSGKRNEMSKNETGKKEGDRVQNYFTQVFERNRMNDRVLGAHASIIEDIICSPVDSSVVIISSGKLFLVDLKLRKVEKVLNIVCEAVCAKMNHNGQLIVVGTSDGFVLLVDMRKNEVVEKWETHTGAVLQMELTSDYTLIYTLGEDSKICCKSLNHTKGKATILVIPEEVKILNPNRKIFSVDGRGKFLLTVGINSGVIYKISETGLLKSLELGGHKTMLTCVDWSFANQCATCVTASQDGKIKISTLLVDTV